MHLTFRRLVGGIGLCATLAATPAFAASAVWIATDGDATRVHTDTLIPTSRPEPAPTLVEPRALLADGKDLPLRTDGSTYVFTPPNAASDLRFTAKSIDSAGVLTFYEARVGRNDVKPVNDLELVPTEPNGTTFRLFWKGNPVPVAQVDVQTSAGWRRMLRPAADGSVSLTSADFPKLFPSRYVLEVSAKLNGKVTLDGKTYEQVLHTATLTFDVPAK